MGREGFIPLLHMQAQGDLPARSRCVVITNLPEVPGHQGEQIGGLGEGVIPSDRMTISANGFLLNRIAIAQQHRAAAATGLNPHLPAAQHIRTILFELSRIANVSLFLGDLGVQMGAVTPVFMAFRDREYVLNLIEGATGGRFHPNFDRIGGLKDDLPKGWLDETRQVMKKLRNFCDEIEDLLFGNEIFQSRTRGIGVIPADVARQYGMSGANLRASGVDWDLRRDQKLPLAYDKVDFRVWTHPDGDSWARCWIRLQEVREATKIVDQLIETLPSGPVMTKVPRIIKVPEGEAWVSTENPLGEMGYYVVSKGDLGPFRVKIRSASFNNISITPWVLKGVYVPDIITILASLYFILGDIDR